MPPPLAGLYADVVAAFYTTFLTLDPVLAFDAAAGARPQCRRLP
jgi:hypothetical protein